MNPLLSRKPLPDLTGFTSHARVTSILLVAATRVTAGGGRAHCSPSRPSTSERCKRQRRDDDLVVSPRVGQPSVSGAAAEERRGRRWPRRAARVPPRGAVPAQAEPTRTTGCADHRRLKDPTGASGSAPTHAAAPIWRLLSDHSRSLASPTVSGRDPGAGYGEHSPAPSVGLIALREPWSRSVVVELVTTALIASWAWSPSGGPPRA